MVLIAHLLLGATIGSLVNNAPLAIILAFLSHYFLDALPHIEYPIGNIKKKQWKNCKPDFISVALDFYLGITLIFIFSHNSPIIYSCAVVATIPDGLSLLNLVVKNKILKIHAVFHKQLIHFLENKKISFFWRISSQVLAVIVSIILLKI